MTDANPDEATPERDQNNPHQAVAKWTRAVALFTLFLVIVSSISDWFIYQQYRVANDSQRDTREQLRAFVTLLGIGVGATTDKEGKTTFRTFSAQFQNLGGTRTAKERAWASVHYFDGDIPNNLDMSKPWTRMDRAELNLGPNTIGVLAPVTVREEEAQRANSKLGKILLWGHHEFSDIFDPDTLYPFAFCFLMNPVPSTDGGFTFAAVPYRDECNKHEKPRKETP